METDMEMQEEIEENQTIENLTSTPSEYAEGEDSDQEEPQEN